MGIQAEDLTPEVQRKLGITRTFSKQRVRSWSLKVLALMAELTPDQRRRVLEHAGRVNRL